MAKFFRSYDGFVLFPLPPPVFILCSWLLQLSFPQYSISQLNRLQLVLSTYSLYSWCHHNAKILSRVSPVLKSIRCDGSKLMSILIKKIQSCIQCFSNWLIYSTYMRALQFTSFFLPLYFISSQYLISVFSFFLGSFRLLKEEWAHCVLCSVVKLRK